MNNKNDNGISFEELDALFSPDFESLLDTYSIKKIETTAIHLYKNINHDKNSFYLRRVMNKRCEILNRSFKASCKTRDKLSPDFTTWSSIHLGILTVRFTARPSLTSVRIRLTNSPR
jgi:mRNA deadenylase 3'-5' endonuclease subunit Ccr4